MASRRVYIDMLTKRVGADNPAIGQFICFQWKRKIKTAILQSHYIRLHKVKLSVCMCVCVFFLLNYFLCNCIHVCSNYPSIHLDRSSIVYILHSILTIVYDISLGGGLIRQIIIFICFIPAALSFSQSVHLDKDVSSR